MKHESSRSLESVTGLARKNLAKSGVCSASLQLHLLRIIEKRLATHSRFWMWMQINFNFMEFRKACYCCISFVDLFSNETLLVQFGNRLRTLLVGSIGKQRLRTSVFGMPSWQSVVLLNLAFYCVLLTEIGELTRWQCSVCLAWRRWIDCPFFCIEIKRKPTFLIIQERHHHKTVGWEGFAIDLKVQATQQKKNWWTMLSVL